MNRIVRSLSCPTYLSCAALAFAFVLGASSSAQAQRYYERGPRDFDGDSHWGPYFAAGVTPGLQLVALDDGQFGLGGEVRLGFSFGRLFQLYLDADFSSASHNPGNVSASDIMLGMRYFFYADHFIGVYARAGLGVGIVSGLNGYYGDTPDEAPNTEYGIAESYALGMEFRLGGPGNKWAISPELFYRRTNETQDARVDSMGLGVLINFN